MRAPSARKRVSSCEEYFSGTLSYQRRAPPSCMTLSCVRKCSSTAILSHSLTRQPPAPSGSATRACPLPRSPRHSSMASSNSRGALPGESAARPSKARSIRLRRLTAASCGGDPRIQRLRQRIGQRLAALRRERPAGLVGNREDVLGALADRHDLGAVQLDILLPEHLPDLG